MRLQYYEPQSACKHVWKEIFEHVKAKKSWPQDICTAVRREQNILIRGGRKHTVWLFTPRPRSCCFVRLNGSPASRKVVRAYLAGESHGLGERVDPLAVLGEFLLVLESCHLQLAVHGRQLRQQRLLPLVGFDGLRLELAVQADDLALQRAVVRLQGSHAAVAAEPALPVGEHQPAAALADAHQPVVARLPHVRVHVAQVEHLAASAVAALGRREVAHLGVLGQMLQLHHGAAAARVVVTFDLQLQDEVLQRQDVVELLGRDPLTFDGAAALLDDPGQHAARAEDVSARSRQRVLQHFIAQVAFEIRVHGPLEAVQLVSHGLAKKKKEEEKVPIQTLWTPHPRRSWSEQRGVFRWTSVEGSRTNYGLSSD